MTPRQNAAYADHAKARRRYETAEPGQKQRYRTELTAAANEVLRADIEAEEKAKERIARGRTSDQDARE